MASCEVKRIQLNSVEAARAEYLACLGPQAQGEAAVAAAQGRFDVVAREARGLGTMNEILLRQLEREVGGGAVGDAEQLLRDELTSVESQIEELKAAVRKGRRQFLDSAPSVSPAVGGLYFTRTPDNQMLIAFLSCFGAFLLFSGCLVLLNQIPAFGLDRLTSGERVKLVLGFWGVSLVLMYAGFFLMT
jgi:hypothetical protein